MESWTFVVNALAPVLTPLWNNIYYLDKGKRLEGEEPVNRRNGETVKSVYPFLPIAISPVPPPPERDVDTAKCPEGL